VGAFSYAGCGGANVTEESLQKSEGGITSAALPPRRSEQLLRQAQDGEGSPHGAHGGQARPPGQRLVRGAAHRLPAPPRQLLETEDRASRARRQISSETHRLSLRHRRGLCPGRAATRAGPLPPGSTARCRSRAETQVSGAGGSAGRAEGEILVRHP